MICLPQRNRPKVRISEMIDADIASLAERAALHYNVDFRELVESALTVFLVQNFVPAPVLFCQEHQCLMEANSSGTTFACPVNEGSEDSAVFPADMLQ